MRKILSIVLAALVMSSCGVYKKYHSQTDAPQDLFGSGDSIAQVALNDSTIAEVSWREFFTDPLLQQLIDSVLVRNTDINSVRIAVEMSEASLKAAKLAYLPSLYFSPQGTLSSFDYGPVSKTYNLPLQLSIDVDAFGAITNQKRKSQALLKQAQIREEALRANLVSTVAQQYFMLQLLDRQLQILMQTDSLWNASLETEKTLWENGKIYSTAVNQMESSYLSVKTQIVDTRRNIQGVENVICRLLAQTPRHINRSEWGSSILHYPETEGDAGQRMFDTRFLKTGVPAMLLNNRPDIRLADYAMEEAYYNTKVARSAFFPSITLSGTAGMVVDPGKMLLSAVASLTQPIFARGRLRANLKIAKLSEEDLQQKYVQTVINAGNQVNEALADCQAALEKHGYYHRQVEVLNEAYKGTHELMDNGKSNYLEVLTAQESLLNSQLSEAANIYNGAKAVIALYIALGGGSK